jgi:hypothetical protein
MYRTDSVAISSFKNIFFQYRLDFARNGGSSRAELIIRPLAFYFIFVLLFGTRRRHGIRLLICAPASRWKTL